MLNLYFSVGGGGSIRERGPQDVSAVPLGGFMDHSIYELYLTTGHPTDTPDPPVKKGRLFLGLGRRGGVTRQSVSLVSSLDPPALRRSRRLNRPLSELYNQFNGSRVDTPAGIQVTQSESYSHCNWRDSLMGKSSARVPPHHSRRPCKVWG